LVPDALLEIGIAQGESINMCKHYFGSKAKIYGLDINPECKQFDDENIRVFIGSQSDRTFLRELKSTIPKIDILIDDGEHILDQQNTSLEELFDHINVNGIYLCEDVHTSYLELYGGGDGKNNIFF
jgi:23S rRNA U2552 (ribose-2'-O)-methylase RlmE/FtsJ